MFIVILFIYQDYLIYLRSQRVCMIEEMEQNISCHAEHSPDTKKGISWAKNMDFSSKNMGMSSNKNRVAPSTSKAMDLERLVKPKRTIDTLKWYRSQ